MTQQRSKLFGGVPLYDIIMEVVAENTRPYSTTLPATRPSNRPTLIQLPRMCGKPIIRAAQIKHAHRERAGQVAAGSMLFTSLEALLQLAQGGFFAKSLRLSDRDELQLRNPIVFLHGAGTVGGQMQFSHLVPIEDVVPEMMIHQIIRGDATEHQEYAMSREGAAERDALKEVHRERRPYNNALARGATVEIMTATADDLRNDGQGDKADEITKFLAKSPTPKEIKAWLNTKKAEYNKKMRDKHIPNVEIRQVLPGYEAIPAGTTFRGHVQAFGVTDYHAGLLINALYRRNPSLGGHAASGGGGYLRQIMRVSVSNTVDTPAFDCLIKIEPFQPLQYCTTDANMATIVRWNNIPELGWQPLMPGPACHITRFMTAWDGVDRSKFDFNFVPRGQAEDGSGGVDGSDEE